MQGTSHLAKKYVA